jgi:L-lactate dehydrogenase (cytochrome)
MPEFDTASWEAECRCSTRQGLKPGRFGRLVLDAVGDRIDVICDGGITRGTHVLKALSVGAKACSGGRFYLYALASAGQAGVERALENLRGEIERDMKLMGCRSVNQLSRDNLRFR